MLLYGIVRGERDYKFTYQILRGTDYMELTESRFTTEYRYKVEVDSQGFSRIYLGIEDKKLLLPKHRETLLSRFIDILCESHSTLHAHKDFTELSLWILIKWLDCYDDEFMEHFSNCIERNYNMEKKKHSIGHTEIDITRFDVSLLQLVPFVVNVGDICYRIIVIPNVSTVEITKNHDTVWKSRYVDRESMVRKSIVLCNLLTEMES